MTDAIFSRRRFMHLCSAALAWLSTPAAAAQPHNPFERVTLVDRHGDSLRAEDLVPDTDYLFFYPYVSTPCFLIRLSRPVEPVALTTEAGETYHWRGGVGPQGEVVGFCAICAHKLSYPAPSVSFIGFRKQPVGYLEGERIERRGSVIRCCSEHSIYDPAAGARVLSGPAPQPLASVTLEQAADGSLRAVGMRGGLLYQTFFERFAFQLELEFGPRYRDRVEGAA
ncbi:MAG: hypothetical protein R3202_06210, partial [Candidatus Competibacterales bacterium]|nr:hypothetical protein [Candidatus Competibacterales bacterium]